MNKNRTVCCLGPVVLDDEIRHDYHDFSMGTKICCTFLTVVGGGAVNAMRQIAGLGGVSTQMLGLVGDDEYGPIAERKLNAEFPSAICLRLLEKTRRSVINGRQIFTARDRLAAPLPASALQILSQAALTLIGPMLPDDFNAIVSVLALPARTVLLLSAEQLKDPHMAFDLARRAWLVVLNHSELQLWVGTSDPKIGIARLHEQGVNQILVTTERGVYASVKDFDGFVPGYQVQRVVTTAGAGDRFLGSLIASLVEEEETDAESWQHAIRRGLAAACLHVSGQPELAQSAEAIERVIAEYPQVTVAAPSSVAVRPRGRIVAAAAATAATILAIVALQPWIG